MPELTEQEIINQANEFFPQPPAMKTVLEACECFYLHGSADEITGDVDSHIGHVYRVARWLVTTDAQGFHSLEGFETEAEAIKQFQARDSEYGNWLSE
jgi:hypothetical protein